MSPSHNHGLGWQAACYIKNHPRWLQRSSAVSLVQPKVISQPFEAKTYIPVTCVHGDTRQVPACRVTIAAKVGSWPVDVGIVKDLPVPVLLGRDWPGLDSLLTSQPASQKGSCQSRKSQVSGGRSFVKEQHADDRLKHCWTQVRIIEGPLLVVPKSKTDTVLELAHSHPLAGHLGVHNTTQRIRDRFHWPGLEVEVKRFCEACPTCQRTSPRKPPPSPLIPLPIIEVPFERIGMDLVGPLPKSARGHEHILVIVDYATRYPEAVPLRKATAKNIARELFMLFSRVGIPSEILTDQGTPFMSRLMADLAQFLKR
ncbi:Retrovirus-related Pol polyprotein [Labeo rohita]|uniref:Gypsy retrotransposon integrase-like protein 1 n=1 Tax=Labeo rohita TaxID=84645 RepID=A0ABQ8LZ15_LABRO|nr:Retrovirus-related Pol polyprotein [Labeo rohita]